MAEWAHVALDAMAMLISVVAFILSWANRKGKEHKEALIEAQNALTKADEKIARNVEEIFGRLNGVEKVQSAHTETLKHQPTIEHIEALRQNINLFSGQIASAIGEVKGELKATTRQVDMMNGYLLREPQQ